MVFMSSMVARYVLVLVSIAYSGKALGSTICAYSAMFNFQDLTKLALIPLYGAIVRQHLEYGIPLCSAILVADVYHLKWIVD